MRSLAPSAPWVIRTFPVGQPGALSRGVARRLCPLEMEVFQVRALAITGVLPDTYVTAHRNIRRGALVPGVPSF